MNLDYNIKTAISTLILTVTWFFAAVSPILLSELIWQPLIILFCSMVAGFIAAATTILLIFRTKNNMRPPLLFGTSILSFLLIFFAVQYSLALDIQRGITSDTTTYFNAGVVMLFVIPILWLVGVGFTINVICKKKDDKTVHDVENER